MTLRTASAVFALFVSLNPTGTSANPLCAENYDSQALLIGNKGYTETFDVPYAHNDIAAIEKFLIEKLCYRKGNIKVLKDATYGRLRTWLGRERNPRGRLWKRARKGKSNVFVYYSGHGVPDAETKKAYLLPRDIDPNEPDSGYGLDQLHRNLNALDRHIGPQNTVTLVIDSCFSGRSAGGALQSHSGSFRPSLPRNSGLIVFTASGAGQLAYWHTQKKLGLFTSVFIDGINGDADRTGRGNKDGQVTGTELAAYLSETVAYRARSLHGREQTPTVPEGDHLGWAIKIPSPSKDKAKAGRVAPALDRDALFWSSIKDSGNAMDFEDYLKRFPKGTFAGLATRRLKSLRKKATTEITRSGPETGHADGSPQSAETRNRSLISMAVSNDIESVDQACNPERLIKFLGNKISSESSGAGVLIKSSIETTIFEFNIRSMPNEKIKRIIMSINYYSSINRDELNEMARKLLDKVGIERKDFASIKQIQCRPFYTFPEKEASHALEKLVELGNKSESGPKIKAYKIAATWSEVPQ